MLISFDPRALIPFKNEGFIRQLLVTIEKQHRYTYHFRHLFEGVDLNFHFLDEIKVRRYCQRHFTNIWTIRSAEDLNKYLDYTDTVTFENIDPEYVKRRLSEKQR